MAHHLALFSRFGFEDPVSDEATYISQLIDKVDPTIGWARFQEIIQSLRARRVLQGSRTLFFVPKALHIYLWKQFWTRYGRGFDFVSTFETMPPSLHAWFLNKFRFAGGKDTAFVVEEILKPDGVFSSRDMLTSTTGSRFLSTLAEANSAAVLRLLESTIGKWSDAELVEFKTDRQNIVWAVEKIAVWPQLTVRALNVLARLAVNENADFSNNSTGTLVSLFRIGPEAAATEASPEQRLPALLRLLRGSTDAERLLGLNALGSALDTRGRGFRTVGPEYQGLQQRAKLWIPKTYGDWWQAHLLYFRTLIVETSTWPLALRPQVCSALLEAVEHQIRTPPCTELAFQILEKLASDSAMDPSKLNKFFWHWQEYREDEQHREQAVPGSRHSGHSFGFHWKRVCSRLVKSNAVLAAPLLDAILTAMSEEYELSYDPSIEELSKELVGIDPKGAWQVTANQFEAALPKWRSDMYNWLKGGIRSFGAGVQPGPIADMPESSILTWIDCDPSERAALIAHAALPTLDDDGGGGLTRQLLTRYGQIEGVCSGISASFHSGSWTGPASLYLKHKRDILRRWLTAGFDFQVTQWIEFEIEHLDRDIQREEINEERDRFE